MNPQLLHQSSKESKKLARLFKKVVIRRKCIEGSNVKYLLDFGKRKVIPDVVTKHGVVFEESANERKKFWLGESFVPLNLLKSYEEKKQARKANKTEFGLLLVEGGKIKKPSSERGFSYLFSRAEKHENHQCGHCNKDVSVRYDSSYAIALSLSLSLSLSLRTHIHVCMYYVYTCDINKCDYHLPGQLNSAHRVSSWITLYC